MIQQFQVAGLSEPNSFSLLYKDGIFWAKCGLPSKEFLSLFDSAKRNTCFWSENFITADVYFEASAKDGTPINGVVTSIKLTAPSGRGE